MIHEAKLFIAHEYPLGLKMMCLEMVGDEESMLKVKRLLDSAIDGLWFRKEMKDEQIGRVVAGVRFIWDSRTDTIPKWKDRPLTLEPSYESNME